MMCDCVREKSELQTLNGILIILDKRLVGKLVLMLGCNVYEIYIMVCYVGLGDMECNEWYGSECV